MLSICCIYCYGDEQREKHVCAECDCECDCKLDNDVKPKCEATVSRLGMKNRRR